MSEMKRIKVTIDAMGNTQVEAQGFNGMGCTDATAPIERALAGAAGVDRSLKSEAYNVETSEEAHEFNGY